MQLCIIIELACFQTLFYLMHHVNSEGNVLRGYCKDERNHTRCCSMFHLVEEKCVECPQGTYRYRNDLSCKECIAGFYGRNYAGRCNTCLHNQTCHLYPGGCKCHDNIKYLKDCLDRTNVINGNIFPFIYGLMIGVPTLLSIIAIVVIIIQRNRVLAGSKRVSIETGTATNASNVFNDVNRTNNMVPTRTLAETALNASLHSMNDSEWSVVSNSENDIYVKAQY